MNLTKHHLLIELTFQKWRSLLGRDFDRYRHHVYRVYNLSTHLTGREGLTDDKLALVSCFHDIGLWSARTFDYLEPSVEALRQHLHELGRDDWFDELATVIRQHHRLRRYEGPFAELTEPFRRADWADVTAGWLSMGFPVLLRDEVQRAFPSLGFRRRLVLFFFKNLLRHPLKPLPMLKW